jgi:hypothetical protein
MPKAAKKIRSTPFLGLLNISLKANCATIANTRLKKAKMQNRHISMSPFLQFSNGMKTEPAYRDVASEYLANARAEIEQEVA